jgi:hypothetical protein
VFAKSELNYPKGNAGFTFQVCAKKLPKYCVFVNINQGAVFAVLLLQGQPF